MPCDQVRQVQVAWTEATDLRLVKLALEAAGAQFVRVDEGRKAVTFEERGSSAVSSLRRGVLTVTPAFDVNALKQDYACRVIEDRFEEQGWDVQETTAVTPAWARS